LFFERAALLDNPPFIFIFWYRTENGEMGVNGVRSCNITKEMLYWPPDQTITDRICKEQFITSPKEEMPKR
jgi:hypothetical protein